MKRDRSTRMRSEATRRGRATGTLSAPASRTLTAGRPAQPGRSKKRCYRNDLPRRATRMHNQAALRGTIGACYVEAAGGAKTQPPGSQGRHTQLFENRDNSAGTQETTPSRRTQRVTQAHGSGDHSSPFPGVAHNWRSRRLCNPIMEGSNHKTLVA